jgi:hypothetical protein
MWFTTLAGRTLALIFLSKVIAPLLLWMFSPTLKFFVLGLLVSKRFVTSEKFRLQSRGLISFENINKNCCFLFGDSKNLPWKLGVFNMKLDGSFDE